MSGYHLEKIEYLTKHVDKITKSKILLLTSQLLDITQHHDKGSMNNILHPRDMNLEQLECHLIELRNKKMETRGVLRKLIQMTCRNGNIQRVNELMKEFNDSNYKVTVGMKAGLLDLYLKSNDLNSAYTAYQEICRDSPLFVIDEFKVLNLLNLMVKNNKFNEAVDLLKSDLKTRDVIGKKGIEKNCWNLLNSLALTGNYEHTKIMFDLLTKYGLCEINNVILGPLVKVHLNK